MDNQNSFGDRQMFQGNWSCSNCGTAITSLPFQPNGTSPLFCRDCHAKKRGQRPQQNRNFGERKMYQGDWTCSSCQKPISELPFQPRDDQSLMCRDCYRNQRD
ncbi:MAG: hypothetical protein Q8Q23_05910 [bacterium]|nr:hypothetical protein [bacterium]